MTVYCMSTKDAIELLYNIKLNYREGVSGEQLAQDISVALRTRVVISDDTDHPDNTVKMLHELTCEDTIKIIVDPCSDCGRVVLCHLNILRSLFEDLNRRGPSGEYDDERRDDEHAPNLVIDISTYPCLCGC